MGGPPVIREVDAPSTIVTVTLTKDGDTIWTREVKFAAGFMLMRKGNQTLEEAVQEAGKPSPARIGSLDFPGYVVKSDNPKGITTLGSSTLTRNGFTSGGTE